MGKKEKKSDLEGLLNTLIQRGWKPTGNNAISFIKETSADVLDWKTIYTAITDKHLYNIHYSLRDLVSKESGLWQFVCENGMVARKRQGTNRCGGEPENCFDYKDYQYRLIESSFKDESELESFILDNIKVDETK